MGLPAPFVRQSAGFGFGVRPCSLSLRAAAGQLARPLPSLSRPSPASCRPRSHPIIAALSRGHALRPRSFAACAAASGFLAALGSFYPLRGAAAMSRVSRASARRALCLRFLLASFVLVAVCPPVVLGRFGLVCPFPAGSPAGRPSRGASRSPLRGCLRALPPPLPLSWSVGLAPLALLGSVGAPSCASPSAQRFAPDGAVFVPLSRGWLVFLPSVPPPASSLRCGCAPRFARKIRAPSRRSWCASPLPPFRGVGSAIGLSFVFISAVFSSLRSLR